MFNGKVTNQTYIRAALLLIAGILTLVVVFYEGDALLAQKSVVEAPTITIGDVSFKAIVVDTQALRRQGLSSRPSLDVDTGMLFIFSDAKVRSFWMKNMHFAIDIIWIDEDLRVIDITHNVLPETFPETVSPKSPVRYVFEVNSGIAKERNIAIGDPVVLPQ